MKYDKNYLNWHMEHAKAWKIMPSPARPSSGEMKIFEKYLDNQSLNRRTNLNVLILGSTPEFRDYCHEKLFDVTCVDINEPIYLAMILLQKTANPEEHFINANWLTFDSQTKFDAIIGDAVTAMLPLDKYRQFFRNLSAHLAINGQLILRVPYQNLNCLISPEQMMQNYRKLKKQSRINIYTATYNYLAMNYLNKQNSKVSLAVLYTKIKELYEKKIILSGEFKELKRFYENLTLELSYPTEKYFNSTYKDYFRLNAKEFSLDYITSFSNPVYIFKK
jgi:hypothetical protein